MNEPSETSSNQRIDFEKSRLEYCLDLFNREEDRREQLEKKSQFYLSFITLFLGAIFLKTESLIYLREIQANPSISGILLTLFYLMILILAGLILFSVIAILQVTRLWSYRGPFPKDLVTALFSPESDFMEENDEAGLIRASALHYAIALEINTSINDRKSRWTMISSLGIFCSVLAFAILIGMMVYFSTFA